MKPLEPALCVGRRRRRHRRVSRPAFRGDAEAFLFDLSSRAATADVLDLAYRRHPRLHFFLTGLLIAGVVVLVIAVPLGVVTCITGGRIPYLGLATGPNNRCLTCCVLLGLLVAVLFGDLSTMLASQVALADAVRRLPATLALTLSELRRYVKQAVQELLVELSDSDQGVANWRSRFPDGAAVSDDDDAEPCDEALDAQNDAVNAPERYGGQLQISSRRYKKSDEPLLLQVFGEARRLWLFLWR
ncbi:hypothetical protein HPB52_012798 [Rhipicephalus sanguineus]|uniref:Uncharacterized protein n=1 Tax=Rhipicephalus sanguineus TaxID=34632 RepID=A0A9D4PX59_RHISA|nr:hypothetical protein HPB52_012798 [Rhipicephalus sanguineus]